MTPSCIDVSLAVSKGTYLSIWLNLLVLINFCRPSKGSLEIHFSPEGWEGAGISESTKTASDRVNPSQGAAYLYFLQHSPGWSGCAGLHGVPNSSSPAHAVLS